MSIRSWYQRADIRCHPIRSTKKKKQWRKRQKLVMVKQRWARWWNGVSYPALKVEGHCIEGEAFVVRSRSRWKEAMMQKANVSHGKAKMGKKVRRWELPCTQCWRSLHRERGVRDALLKSMERKKWWRSKEGAKQRTGAMPTLFHTRPFIFQIHFWTPPETEIISYRS
jgi:hypothetical protein